MNRAISFAIVAGLANFGAVCCSADPKSADSTLGVESALGEKDDGPATTSVTPDCSKRCDTQGSFTKVADVPYALDELSGLAPSRVHAKVLYAHNDSGDSARFFAFGTDGTPRGEFSLAGATATDWEDIGTGPCPDGTPCVFIGDIGDNAVARASGTDPENYAIYVAREPTLDPKGGKAQVAFARLPFAYPDGGHNAETLLVDPKSGDLFVVTKSKVGASAVYRYPKPLMPGVTVTLVKVVDWIVPPDGDRQLTGGDIHPCERRVVLRTYNRGYEFVNPQAKNMAELFQTPPRAVALPTEIQGEAIAYDVAGTGIFTSSEMPLGGAPALNHAGCSSVASVASP